MNALTIEQTLSVAGGFEPLSGPTPSPEFPGISYAEWEAFKEMLRRQEQRQP